MFKQRKSKLESWVKQIANPGIKAKMPCLLSAAGEVVHGVPGVEILVLRGSHLQWQGLGLNDAIWGGVISRQHCPEILGQGNVV